MANFFLKLKFKNLKVVLEAAEDVEATIMNTQTLKELGSKVPPLETLLPDMEKNLRDFSFPMMERDIPRIFRGFFYVL